ncbi:MAG: hypothetical protein Q8R78_04030 [Candidatus Omnitrophota bacterium]|nr:hypothetical protein [Candidatus Omnitrophota bacterium]
MNLFSWLSRHPLKGPSDMNRAQYTAEVMAKINAVESPAPAPAPVRSWLPWPRLAMTLATVAAGVLIMMSVTHQAPERFAQPPSFDSTQDGALSEVEGPPELVAPVVLAESPAGSEDQWFDETLQLLDELDEGTSSDSAGNGSDDEWLEELELLDETDLAANS